MFSKANKSNGRDRRYAPSIIGSDCRITGDLFSQGEVQIDGRVDGDIRCDSLVIGESGSITGEISAETVRVLGSVTGQIKARSVALSKTARIIGDITHDSLSVEAGAYVEGRFNRLTAEPEHVVEPALPPADRNAAGQALLTNGKKDTKKDAAATATPSAVAG